MVAHVQGDEVDWSVIAERLLVEIVRVVLLNPTGANWVQPNRREKREREIKKSRTTAKIHNCCIIHRRTCEIDEEPPVPHFDRFQSRRPSQLEKWKEREPDRLAIPLVADQPRFPMVREISVVFVIALMRMMLQMIHAKTHCTGNEVREICDDGHDFVPAFAPQNQIVGCIVNDHVVGMIGERADAISDQKTEPPVTESECAHAIRDRCLHYYDRQRDERSVRIAHHQLANFGMRFDDRSRAAGMRLIKLGLVEKGLHGQAYFLAQNSRKDHLLPKVKLFAKIGRFAQSARHWPS